MPAHAERLGAHLVADAANKDTPHPRHHRLLGDLAPYDVGGVRLASVLIGRVNLVLDGLQQPPAEVDCHSATSHPLCLQLLKVARSGCRSSVSRDVSWLDHLGLTTGACPDLVGSTDSGMSR
jgi:hypothetical protein